MKLYLLQEGERHTSVFKVTAPNKGGGLMPRMHPMKPNSSILITASDVAVPNSGLSCYSKQPPMSQSYFSIVADSGWIDVGPSVEGGGC